MKNRFVIEFDTEEDIVELNEQAILEELSDFVDSFNIPCSNIKTYYQDQYCIEEEKQRLRLGKILRDKKYPIITLCGSTKFKDEFLQVQKDLTLKGYIVLSVGCFGHSGDNEVWNNDAKVMLDDMHKRKIDLADAIMVINKDNYIGESTKSEIEYAKQHNKKILYLE